MPEHWFENQIRDPSWTCQPAPTEVQAFHREMAGYEATPLTRLADVAEELEVGRVFAKVESSRFGLPAFKALGASWAIERALGSREDQGVTLVTASDGNHGRAVAHFARQLGHGADIFVPEGIHPDAIEAIRGEGANVTVLSGSYDEVVAAASDHSQQSSGEGARVLIQDTGWDGYEEVPRWIVEGYSTLFSEIDGQLGDHGLSRPDLVIVPSGVGSLLHAALAHYRSRPTSDGTVVVSVEPVTAACVFASVAAGTPTSVETDETVMAGLNCGTLSSPAWESIAPGLDGCVTVTDEHALSATRDLMALGVDAGPCGGASLAALQVLYGSDVTKHELMGSLGLPADPTVVLLVTEGSEANPWLASD